jgi:hypothetical protein
MADAPDDLPTVANPKAVGDPQSPPANWLHLGTVTAPPGWHIEWLDPSGAVIDTDPIIGFVFWQDANTTLRVDPLTSTVPVFPEQQTQPYRVRSPK